MTRSQRAWHLAGETVREVGTLTLVFAPLQAVFETPTIPIAWIGIVMIASVLLIAGGILLETRD
jgi:hypothetical protein